MDNKDAFDLWWEWAEKSLDSMLTIDSEIHEAVMALSPDERHNRAKVNEAVGAGRIRPLADSKQATETKMPRQESRPGRGK
jgi:hypothetical protein